MSSWFVRRVVYIWQRNLSSGIQGVDIVCTKSKDKGKSQAGGLGTRCRSQGPNQDKSLVFAFVIFSVI